LLLVAIGNDMLIPTIDRGKGGDGMGADFVITRELPDTEYDSAVSQVTERLGAEGFGVLTEIDVKATLKKKLDADFRRYIILGACNPTLAHQALTIEPFIGALLPCNVVVMERDGGGSVVFAFKPSEGFKMVDRQEVKGVADEVEARLERALAGLG
jgi:uncharacterized protein (DUF302 family)